MPRSAEVILLLLHAQELTDHAAAELERDRRDDLLARRADLVRTLERPLSLRLDRLEQRYPGSAIARIADDACPHCRIQVPTATLCRIQRRESVETCSKCGRVLVWDEVLADRASKLNAARQDALQVEIRRAEDQRQLARSAAREAARIARRQHQLEWSRQARLRSHELRSRRAAVALERLQTGSGIAAIDHQLQRLRAQLATVEDSHGFVRFNAAACAVRDALAALRRCRRLLLDIGMLDVQKLTGSRVFEQIDDISSWVENCVTPGAEVVSALETTDGGIVQGRRTRSGIRRTCSAASRYLSLQRWIRRPTAKARSLRSRIKLIVMRLDEKRDAVLTITGAHSLGFGEYAKLTLDTCTEQATIVGAFVEGLVLLLGSAISTISSQDRQS